MKTRKICIALAAVLLSATTVVAKALRTVVFKVSQMTCENCVKKINSNIRFEIGLKKFDTDLKTKTVTITYDADKTDIEKNRSAGQQLSYYESGNSYSHRTSYVLRRNGS